MNTVAAVVIGRNEGQRLLACFESLTAQLDRIVYVDSGSTDGSQEAARARGIDVVALDMSQPFTAARARNAGLAQLERDGDTAPDFIQFIDGDCVLQPGWIETALTFLTENPQAAVACGRRRERHPEASIYNVLADLEWDTPIGQARACGGDALMRRAALREVGGYNPRLIAGEEPELCVRLRQAGWQIWRLDAEMTLHDAAITRISQWWIRAKRAGYAFAEGAALHGAPPERHNVAVLRHAVLWGLLLPAATVALTLAFGLWGLLPLLLLPAQMLRLTLMGFPWFQSVFFVLGRFPEGLGVLSYHWRRRTSGKIALIEYK